MSEEQELISKERVLELIGSEEEVIHVFLNPGGMLIGADWSRKRIEKLLDEAESIEIGGDGCQRMNHPICVLSEGRYHFLEVRDWKNR